MRTLLLPGYSERNRQWAEDVKKDLNPEIDLEIYEWEHWPSTSSGSMSRVSMSIPREKKRILKLIGNEHVNIIAKSVGTRVLMSIIPETKDQLNIIILCGIPSKMENEKTRELYTKSLSLLSPSQVKVFQNEKDPLANYSVIEKFIHSVNPKIEVKNMPRSDHHYPYSKNFHDYLINKA